MTSKETKFFSCFFLFLAVLTLSWRSGFGTEENSEASEKCDKALPCTFWEFQCKSYGCINMRKFCDGHIDCPDGSDEIISTKALEVSKSSNRSEIPCNNAMNEFDKTCSLPLAYVCDSIPQCRGNADESEEVCGTKNRYIKRCSVGNCMNSWVLKCPGCENVTGSCDGDHCRYFGTDKEHHCASNIFRCKSGECLSADQFCDGKWDCEDGSDEVTEATNGDVNGVLCNNKWNYVDRQCFLPQYHVCDGINHCENRTDECAPDCDYSFICENGNCITSTFKGSAPGYLNDGRDDCGDSSDELTSHSDKRLHFKCCDPDNTLLALEKFCDGVVDCPNKADEQMESDETTLCSNNWLLVPRGFSCSVPIHHICDDYPMCDDSIDEANCGNGGTKPNLFQCLNGDTIDNLLNIQCDFKYHCKDYSDECPPRSPMCNTTFTCASDGKCLPFSKFCDGVRDCDDGSDELQQSGSGFLCKNAHTDNNYNDFDGKCVLPERYMCDGLDHCVDRADECEDHCDKSFYCDNGQCVDRGKFCDGTNDCRDSSDEKITGSGFKCDVRRKSRGEVRTCILPQTMLNDSVGDCADKSDLCFDKNRQTCFRCLSQDLYISPKQVCDGEIDCPDLSDECLCEDMTSIKRLPEACKNLCMGQDTPFSFANAHCDIGQVFCDSGKTYVNFSQVCDNVKQCSDGADENACTTARERKDRISKPKNFTCKNSMDPDVAVECDGIVECTDFSDECSRIPNEVGKTQVNETALSVEGKDRNRCSTYTDERAFKCGNRTMKICSSLLVDYAGFYHCPGDYQYAHTAKICNGIEDCLDKMSPTRPPWPISLPRTWSDFSVDESDCRYRALCEKSRPINLNLVSIHQDQVCDGIIDCMKEEDEAESTCGKLVSDRFYCETRRDSISKSMFLPTNDKMNSLKDPLFVSMRLMFDGKKDCWDGSDECPSSWSDDNPFSSRHRLIRDAILNVLVWAMAIIAILGNVVVICHTSLKLIKSRRLSPMMKTNCILVLNLAIADLLMGFYLLALAIENSLKDGIYCKEDLKWRTSQSCAALGTLAMTSIQCSVLILIILTTYRMLAVLKPFSADSVQARYTGVLIFAAWFVSILVACLPRLDSLEDYFTSAAWIAPGIDFFATNTPNKSSFYQFVKRLQVLDIDGSGGSTSISLMEDESAVTWSAIREALSQLYPKIWPQYKIQGYFKFYGSNSVCLPQMFVTVSHSGWGYSVAVMTFDLIAFLYILISYLVIYHDAKRVVANNRNDDENRTMQARITRLVLTDFACWVPVCIIAFCSLAGLKITSSVYAVAAIVLLPINSALNPILYSNVINVIYNSCIKPGTVMARKRFLMGRESLSRVRKRSTFSRTSMAVSMTSNDYIHSPEGVPMLSHATNSAISQHNASVTTTTTRI